MGNNKKTRYITVFNVPKSVNTIYKLADWVHEHEDSYKFDVQTGESSLKELPLFEGSMSSDYQKMLKAKVTRIYP